MKVPDWTAHVDDDVWPSHGHVWTYYGNCVGCAEYAVDAAEYCPILAMEDRE